tara:strand:+ start:484 stop:1158 length:675 start_codon:yes stop_codon:yes gene_type:complete
MGDKIIFDFDGVILDSFPDQFNWFQHICNFLEKPFPYSSLDELKKDYREPVYPDMYSFLGFDWNKEKNVIWDEYIKHKAHSEVSLFDGIDNVIKELHGNGKTLAIASSNTHDAIYRQLDEHKLRSYFDVVIGKDDLPVENGEPQLKPHPACLLLALDQLGCKPAETKYVGDQPSDIIAARRVREYRDFSMPVVAVTYGFSPKEELLKMNPEAVAYSPKELPANL